MEKIIEELERCIKESNVFLSLLAVVHKERIKVSSLCATVISKNVPNSYVANIEEQVLNQISKLVSVKEDCVSKIQLLESAINYGKKISSDIYPVHGINTIIESFNGLKDTWHRRRVCELKSDEFWGTLFPFLNPAEALQPLINSLSFKNLARKSLKDLSNSDTNEYGSCKDEGTSNKAVSDFYSLMTFLTTRVIEELQAQWNPVLKDPSLLSLPTMKTILGSLKDQDKLVGELELLESYFRRKFLPLVRIYIEDYVKYPKVLKKVRQVIGIFKIFGFADASNETISTLVHFETTLENSSELTLESLHHLMKEVTEILASFSGEYLDCVIEELSRSSELLAFIEEIVDEDIRFLIDAVEEHSDQYVSESSVSDLIDIHGFLAPLVLKKKQQKCKPHVFLNMLKDFCLDHKDIAIKLKQCSTNVNSLRGLYMSIANRGEITKEIINNCLNSGEYWISQKNGAMMSYEVQGSGGEKRCNYSLEDLHDLRSRAHLIVSSHKNDIKHLSSHSNESTEDIDFEKFINQVNLLTEISTLLSKLLSSGYVKYRNFWKKIKTTDDLQNDRDILLHDLQNWENMLKEAREKFYFLNYYRSDQLGTLYDFLMNDTDNNCDEALSLIHFVDQFITRQELDTYRQSQKKKLRSNKSPELLLLTVGEALENIFSNSQRVVRLVPNEDENQSYVKLDAIVTPGEIFVASLEPESPLTTNVILTLYENTSKAFPEPYQIIFCSSQTTWEELYLLLQRCFAQSKNLHCKSLFCIANVELLPNELQFELVIAIKEKQKSYETLENINVNAKYQLALICRGGDHHHIVEQFSQYSHHISGMSDLALANRLRSSWPEVRMITSTLPGLGKTEWIKREVLNKKMNVVTFSISGLFEPEKIMQRFKKLQLKKYHCLHMDIGEVSNPLSLDTFLFQLIVIGMVSGGNQFYHLPTTHIYIEIANSLKDWLRESFVVSKFFTRIDLEWQNYKNLLVSAEITSNVQIVCQYLHLFDEARIESREVNFSGPKKVKPLPAQRCQELLAKYFSSDADITFTTLHTFLRVLADQLIKFSNSAFFKIGNLKSMMDNEAQGVRTTLFDALLNVTKEIASRALTTSRSSEIRNLSEDESAKAFDLAATSPAKTAKDMVERVKGMIQWEDSNHLLVVFHGLTSQAITAVYRDKNGVPLNVKKLLISQDIKGNKELEDFKSFTQQQLQEKLEKIACMKMVGQNNLFPGYVLTPDNVLKMILIVLRVRANVPVVIMGETGCGKTSLVRYLARTCGVNFYVFNFHAGISEEDIVEFIEEKENFAKDNNQQMWIFLDEINTCDHLGLMSDIMCHHSLLGQPLSRCLVFLAACNPYKLRPTEHITTAGLEGKNVTDEYSGLVYRVHPLPEAMIDYVWDYGSLTPKDERDYIQRMVRHLPKEMENVLLHLLSESQRFIREAEKNPYCVSLRDVHRCIRLISWFENMSKKRKKLNHTKDDIPYHLRFYHIRSSSHNEMTRSIVLALAHCYLSRLPTAELRQKYRKNMIDLFLCNGIAMSYTEKSDDFAAIIRMEEEDYLDRMELPPGTARNAALRENVFVMLVCILNRIPIFVVGKPGCSKSLSIQLIRSNLRGRDSRDLLFRELPQLYVVSYQGSESSTSEGIIKVFEKARKYQLHNKDGNVLPVVLLDEVGLAENSKYNPLKVLHSLLEPGDGKLPDVAVVGISNWSLDAAKMNRAIHLSRPEPTKEDLYETGESLHHAESSDSSQSLGKQELQCLAESYFEYQAQQRHANFHGLRDYYSLIKSLAGCNSFHQVNISLQRNFGGLQGELTNIQKIFLDKLKKHMTSSDQKIIPVTQLIQANLKDPHARHLMLITSKDSALGILKQSLNTTKKEIITIYGSRFEEDLSEEYNYRILSRIILCMERDCILILRDLESIYGSLYDMLNQNYAIVGNRKNCRVALGAYSNPMCQVNDGFRCIVLIDQYKVDFSDPPFLNRFEKQLLRFQDVLTEDQQNLIYELRCWVEGVSTIQGLESQFSESDMFIGFHDDSLPSLVLLHSKNTDNFFGKSEEILKKCKDDLMWVASPDGVLRMQKCVLLKEDSLEVQKISDEYFVKPVHQGFAAFMEYVANSSVFTDDNIGSKTVVMTFSNIHTDICQCLGNGLRSQVERLSAYKSEKQLAERIDKFWNAPDKELLVLQSKPELDGTHLLLARSIIEEKRNTYKQCLSKLDVQSYKHVCIVVHVQRGEAEESVPWQFSFLCGWRQVFLDILEVPPVPLSKIRGLSVQSLLTSSIWPISRIAQNDLLWCFTCIKYTGNQRPLEIVLHIARNLFKSEAVSQVIENFILKSIDGNSLEHNEDIFLKESWQVRVACDRQSLVNSSTLYCAMEKFVSRLVRNPLAKIVYFLEKENAWPPHLNEEYDGTLMPMLEDLWCKFINNNEIFRITEIPEPLGAESYVLESTSLDLILPFSQVVIKKVNNVKEVFMEDYAQLEENEDNYDENGQLKQLVRQDQLERFSKMIMNLVTDLHYFTPACHELYMKDLFDIITADFSQAVCRSQRVLILKAMFVSQFKENLPLRNMPEFFTMIHIFVWAHREQILDLLKMVDCSRPFIGLNAISGFTELSGSLDILNTEVINSIEQHELHKLNDVIEYQNETRHTEDQYANDDVTENNNASNADAESCKDEIDQSTEDSVEEKKDLHENAERFGDTLVTIFCWKMFPSEETVERNGGLEQWTRNANLLLSLAVKISEHSSALHFLRLCVDFSRMILLPPTPLPKSLPALYIFNEIGIALAPEYLDHPNSFEMITDQLISPLEEEIKHHTDKEDALVKFSALFYGRCIDTNVDTSCSRFIVEQVLSLERSELVMIMSPVLLRLLMVEEMQSPGIFMKVVTDETAIENCPCLQTIDEVFKDRFSHDLMHHDSYASVMICDLIQCLLKFESHFTVEDINSSDCEVLMLAKSASKLISQGNRKECGLRILSAVAVLRGFFTILAKLIVNTSALKEDSPYVSLMLEVNSLLKYHKSSLQFFFMKQLREHASLFDLQKFFKESKVLSALQQPWCDENIQEKAVFPIPLKSPEYTEAKAAYFKLSSGNSSSMEEYMIKCKNSPNHAFSLFGILTNMIYLKRAVRKLTDKEEQMADWFAKEVAFFPKMLQELFMRVIGRHEFHCAQLQLSPESSVEEVEMALLVLHIASIVGTGALDEKSPFYMCLINPSQLQQVCVPAHGEEAKLRSTFEFLPFVKDSVHFTCECGFRLSIKDDSSECPCCHEVLRKETVSFPSFETFAVPSQSSFCDSSFLCTTNLNPAVYRALHLIVYSSFYAGLAIGSFSEESLSTSLNSLHGFHFDRNSSNPESFCFENIQDDLSHLMKILCCKKDFAIKTMHLVVEETSNLIRNNLQGVNDFSKLEIRREWEETFSQLTEDVFLKSRGMSKELKEILKPLHSKDSENITLNCSILELDNYPKEPEEQKQDMKRLFRVTKQPSLEDFRSAFLFSPKDVKEKHCFLNLFFATFNQLQIIHNLYHLLKWSRLVSSSLTHRISRKDAETKSINDFICGHLLELKRTPQQTESLKILFNNFIEAWNTMRPLVNQKLLNKKEKMPRLVQNDYVAYCLLESQHGVYLKTAIEILVSYQNLILDAMISLSSSYSYPALSFLEKEKCSGVMSISVQNAKQKDIISYQWSDELFKYGQSNLEYGRGREVKYDFQRIEIWLATKIAFGKCYLTGTLNKIIFAKELFHSCGPLLTEIRLLVRQTPTLPNEVQKGLSKLKEGRITDSQHLLQHIEVLIFLIKRKLKNFDVEMTLEELAEKWSKMLPSPFPLNLLPDPKSSIKIKHVAALYEALEDMLADGAIDGLADRFRQEMPKNVKEIISSVTETEIEQLKPQNFIKALRRFIFRYLSSDTEKHWPEEDKALRLCLEEPSLWSPLSPPKQDEISKEITLNCIYSLLKYLEEIQKVKFKIIFKDKLQLRYF